MKEPNLVKLKHWKWWLLVALNAVFLLLGQSAATVLGRFYFKDGGKSLWMATLVQSAAFPVLFLLFFLLPSAKNLSSATTTTATIISQPSTPALTSVYILLGLLLAGDNMLYSIGLYNLPLSTYSLLCATQLAFNAVFSFFINSQKFTPFILNSVILLILSAFLIAGRSEEDPEEKASKPNPAVGFSCTIAASAGYALLLSLMEFSFERVVKKETFSAVLEMQIYTSLVATCVCVVGLFAGGEWKDLKGEMEGSKKGKAAYALTLVGIALSWQVSLVGVVGLVFMVSALFSNVVSMLALPLVPVGGVLFFKEKMDGVKVVATVLAMWGFASYIYHHYLDDKEAKMTENGSPSAENGSMVLLENPGS